MATWVIFEARAKPQQLQPLLAFLRNHLPDTRSYEGCLEIYLYLGEDRQTVVMVEQW